MGAQLISPNTPNGAGTVTGTAAWPDHPGHKRRDSPMPFNARDNGQGMQRPGW